MSDNLKVLIVEDEPNVRLGCQQTLELEGMDVDAVESAEKARRLVPVDFAGSSLPTSACRATTAWRSCMIFCGRTATCRSS